MSHGPEHHLEEAEHAQNAVPHPFDRRVAMTMAIVAAALACVTMLGHREHNETLRLQTQANIQHTLASNQWAYYQAKNIRQHEYEAFLELVEVIPRDAGATEARDRARREWQKKVGQYSQDLRKIEEQAEGHTEQARTNQEASERAHHRASRFDLGELGVELALVLCSIAVLTKRPEFWYSGIAFGLVGFLVALSGLLMH